MASAPTYCPLNPGISSSNKRIIMDGSAKVLGVVKRALTEDAVEALEAPTGPAPL